MKVVIGTGKYRNTPISKNEDRRKEIIKYSNNRLNPLTIDLLIFFSIFLFVSHDALKIRLSLTQE